MTAGTEDILAKKFNKLSGKKSQGEKTKNSRHEESSGGIHNPAEEAVRRATNKTKLPSAPGDGVTGPSRYFPGNHRGNFNPVLAVLIAKFMPLYWDSRWTHEELYKLAQDDGAIVRKGNSDIKVQARMTVVIDRLHIMHGNQLTESQQGYRELQFVKDVIRFRHVLGKEHSSVI